MPCRERRWAEARRLDAVSSTFEDGAPTLTADELTLVFHRRAAAGDGGRYELWTTTRKSRAEAFPPPERLADVGSSADDAYPMLTSDGVTLLFASRRLDPDGPFRLFRAERPDVVVGFSPATPVEPADAEAAGWPSRESSALYPSLTPDRTSLYFSASDGPRELYRIFRSERLESGDFAAPVPEMPAHETISSVAFVMSSDRRTAFVSRGPEGGPYWIHAAVRPDASEPFGPFHPVDELKGGDTRAGWLSPDSCRLYLAKRRADAADPNDFDIYVADRRP